MSLPLAAETKANDDKEGILLAKRISDALELSAHTRRLHVLHGLLEYVLVIMIAILAITATSIILADQLTYMMRNNKAAPTTISTLTLDSD